MNKIAYYTGYMEKESFDDKKWDDIERDYLLPAVAPAAGAAIGGISVPDFGPTGMDPSGATGTTGAYYIPGIYYLARGPLELEVDLAQLYRSTGNMGALGVPNSDAAWDPINPGVPYKYFETYNLKIVIFIIFILSFGI